MLMIRGLVRVHVIALVLLNVACAMHQEIRPDQKIRVLLDSDANNELDDQHAIAYMLFSGDRFNVEGVTVNRTNSGGDIEAQLTEAQRVVRLSGLDGHVPVLKGADASFTDIAPQVGNVSFDGSEAVQFIIDKAHAPGNGRLVLIPVGKLTNIALALKKDPSIAPKVRVVWLGSNYPEPGEYNQENDEPALQYLLDANVHLEIALVRYGKPSGTDAVRVTREEIRARMAGKGPMVRDAVVGRHGGEFRTFGDYSINLFEHIELHGTPPSRALYDMAAVAIVKDPSWATARRIPAPQLVDGKWVERPENARTITIWENFSRERILADFYRVMNRPRLAGKPRESSRRPAETTSPRSQPVSLVLLSNRGTVASTFLSLRPVSGHLSPKWHSISRWRCPRDAGIPLHAHSVTDGVRPCSIRNALNASYRLTIAPSVISRRQKFNDCSVDRRRARPATCARGPTATSASTSARCPRGLRYSHDVPNLRQTGYGPRHG